MHRIRYIGRGMHPTSEVTEDSSLRSLQEEVFVFAPCRGHSIAFPTEQHTSDQLLLYLGSTKSSFRTESSPMYGTQAN